jgi:8-oxo-dGTP diphosphatase
MRERFKMIGEVHLFLVRPGELLMIRRFNTGFADGLFSIPAGHMDGAEEVRAAAIREAREEVGVEISLEALQPVGIMHRLSNDERVSFFFAATRWEGEPRNCEPDKCDAVAWYPWDALPENTIPYIKRAWENYRSGIWFSSYGWNGEE